jgi:hypothetical protein
LYQQHKKKPLRAQRLLKERGVNLNLKKKYTVFPLIAPHAGLFFDRPPAWGVNRGWGVSGGWGAIRGNTVSEVMTKNV